MSGRRYGLYLKLSSAKLLLGGEANGDVSSEGGAKGRAGDKGSEGKESGAAIEGR